MTLWVCMIGLTITVNIFSAGVVDLWGTPSSIDNILVSSGNGDFLSVIRNVFLYILRFARIALNGVALLALLYVAFLWVTSMGDEEKQTEGRTRIILIFAGLFLLNIPEILYRIFTGSSYDTLGFGTKVAQVSNLSASSASGVISENELGKCNFFFCPQNFWWNGSTIAILKILEISLIVVAVAMITWWGFLLIFGWDDESRSNSAKRRIGYGIVVLLITGMVESVYRAIIFSWSMSAIGNGLIRTLVTVANFFLFLAGPVAIICIIIWWYMYITSAWNEEKADRWKRVLLYTFFATIMIILSYTFLLEVVGLNIF